MTLELLIPPLPLTLVVCGIIFLAAHFVPISNLVFSHTQGEWAIAFWVISLLFVIPAALHFFKAKTTVDPRYPEKSQILVINGIYKFSRNPMYVGFWFAIIGCTLFTGNALGGIFTLFFIPYMNRFQILPEERHLKQKFGEAYTDYCLNVRRWL